MSTQLTQAFIHADGTIRNAVGRIVCQDGFDEQQLFEAMEGRIRNALGFEVNITTLTEIKRAVVQQQFYEIPIADYLPILVGEGAFATNLLQYTAYSLADDFETGNIDLGANNARLAEVDIGMSDIQIKIKNWAKALGYTLFELQTAQKSGNWSVIEQKEKARYENWALGLQKIAFLGSAIDSNVPGLLTQSTVNSNTTLLTNSLKSLSTTDFSGFVGGVLSAYQTNNNFTAMPDRFIIPATDFLGLGAPVSTDFPVNTKLAYLEETFQRLTGKKDFRILPLAYAQKDRNSGITGLNKNRYTLLKYNNDSVEMNIPLDYTTTIQDTTNGFQWQSAAYGQYTGPIAKRPLEMLYFDNTATIV